MRVLLFSIVAICIAGSRTQEIAIGTEYLRAHVNDTFPSESIINAEDGILLLPAGLSVANSNTPSTSSSTTASPVPADNNNPQTNDSGSNTQFDHEHQDHHNHTATISVDLHNILDLFTQQLQETEKRIISAIQPNNPSNTVIAMKSYRTHERWNEENKTN